MWSSREQRPHQSEASPGQYLQLAPEQSSSKYLSITVAFERPRMSPFTDRVALITGAGSGIGRQLALALSAEGARIAALDLRAESLEALAAALPGKAVAHAVA